MPEGGLTLAVETALMSILEENNLSSWRIVGGKKYAVLTLKFQVAMSEPGERSCDLNVQGVTERNHLHRWTEASWEVKHGKPNHKLWIYKKNIWTNSDKSELWKSDMWPATCNKYHWQWTWGSVSDLHSWQWRGSGLHWW